MRDYLKFINSDIMITIKGLSMYPTLYEEEKVKLKINFNVSDLYQGRIILFYNKIYKEYVIHRIIKVVNLKDGGEYFVTKGDNNLVIDHYLVTVNDIRGIL